MKLLMLCLTVAACSGAPHVFQYPAVSSSGPAVAYTPSLSPSLMKIPAPGINMHVPMPVHNVAPVQYTAPAPVVAPVQMAAPSVVVAQSPEPLMAPEPPMPSVGAPYVGGQFHAQDEAGQYTFGHWGGPNTRVEARDYLGRTSGSFAYVNPKGDVQTRKYAAAPAMGFKVAASDLPEDEPVVAQVKSALAEAHQDVKNMLANTAVSTA